MLWQYVRRIICFFFLFLSLSLIPVLPICCDVWRISLYTSRDIEAEIGKECLSWHGCDGEKVYFCWHLRFLFFLVALALGCVSLKHNMKRYDCFVVLVLFVNLLMRKDQMTGGLPSLVSFLGFLAFNLAEMREKAQNVSHMTYSAISWRSSCLPPSAKKGIVERNDHTEERKKDWIGNTRKQQSCHDNRLFMFETPLKTHYHFLLRPLFTIPCLYHGMTCTIT